MNAFGRIFRAQARRDRVLLAIWILGIALLGSAAAGAVGAEFADEAERAAIVALASANPAFLFLRGLPDGLSVGAVVYFQAFSFTAVLAGLMSTFLVVRHTRADEEAGRAELVGSTPIRRTTPLSATLTLGVLANALLVVAVAVGYVAGGLPPAGSLVAATAVGSVGLVFVAVTAIVSQVVQSSRASNGIAAALVGLGYLLRGVGDALGTPDAAFTRVTPAWISWLSPIGWGQATRPFTEASLTPLLLSATVFVVLVGSALALRSRRDLGSSLLPERSGRARAIAGGRSVLGLAWRLQRATLLGWCVGAAALGSIAGGLGPVVAEAVAANPSLRDLIGRIAPGSDADITEVFAAALMGIAGVLAAAAGVQAILRLRAEEAEGRAELLLSTPVSRARWLGSSVIVAVASVLAVCTVTGFVVGVAVSNSSGDAGAVGQFTGAALAHAPAALVFVALTALLYAVVPRLSIALGWGLLVVGLVVGQFGELLRIPGWLQDISPFRHTSALPVEDLDVASALILVVIAIAGAGLATVFLRRRDIVA